MSELPSYCGTKDDQKGRCSCVLRPSQVASALLADERERIAAAIEARQAAWDDAWPNLAAAGATVGPGTVRVAYTESARIAREGTP